MWTVVKWLLGLLPPTKAVPSSLNPVSIVAFGVVLSVVFGSLDGEADKLHNVQHKSVNDNFC